MKDFEKINWKLYNKPPFYQQWLCREDTQKLATFGDRGLGEVDDQVLALKDQWDLDNVSGYFLDRIGKLLSENRNGNTDAFYRILLKLRSLLNTNNGSIPSIIKAIKFIYSSEVVHIVPDYPAGLIIEHDGEGTPGLNFNKLLTEIVPAGVSFSTKEIFNFIEEFFSTEASKIIARAKPVESFENKIYHDGRILRDGYTMLPTEMRPYFHDKTNLRDGSTYHIPKYKADGTTNLIPPFLRMSGYQDPISMNLGLQFTDIQQSQLFHNGIINRKIRAAHDGSFKRNGITNRMPPSKHNGRSELSISDYISKLKTIIPVKENFPASDTALMKMIEYSPDPFRKPYNRNGTFTHNSSIFHSGWILDFLALVQKLLLQDTFKATMYHNQTILRNGSETHSLTGNLTAYEKGLFNIKNNNLEYVQANENQILNIQNDNQDILDRGFKHNANWNHDGIILRSGKLNERFGIQARVPVTEKVSGTMYRNAVITRNGAEDHSLTGGCSVYEVFNIKQKNNYFEPMGSIDTHSIFDFAHTQSEEFSKDYKRNKKIYRNHTAFRSNYIIDNNVMDITTASMFDTHRGRMLRYGDVMRNGAETHQSSRLGYDSFTIGMRYRHYRNAVYTRNLGIQHNANVLIPL
jgi:hypothetical protein